MVELSEQELQALYAWIDEVPLSRPKKNIARDFSDGVMAAEIVNHFIPRLVELHNYSAANSTTQKLENWRLLNRKVFIKIGVNVPDELLQGVVACKPGVIEYILDHLKSKIEDILKSVGDELHPLFGGFSDTSQHYHFNSTAGNTVINQMQDTRHRHSLVSPSLPQQASINLPPLVKSPRDINPLPHPSKPAKPSHIPRPTNSGLSTTERHALPPINGQGGVAWGGVMSVGMATSHHSKLPVAIKDRTKAIPAKTSKRDLNYASHRLGVPAHWFKRGSNTNKDSTGGGGGLSKDGMLVMAEKDQMIMELQETVQLLQMKVKRLEHLIKIKDYKLRDLDTCKTGQTMR